MIKNSYIDKGDISRLNVQSAPDRISGDAAQGKKLFDRLPEFIAEKHNLLVEELTQKGTQPVQSVDMKLVRVNPSSGVLEYSQDGVNFSATASSGHRILNEFGDILVQRGDLQFVGTEIFDDGARTVIKGIKGDSGVQGLQGVQGVQGEKGERGAVGNTGAQGIQGAKGDKGDKGNDGANGNDFLVSGRYPTLLALQTARPRGNVGEAWFVGTELVNPVYLWFENSATWENVGKIQGPQGGQGIQGERGVQGERGAQGNQGVQGVQGIQGAKGDRGVQGVQGSAGQGVPVGGTLGQALVKNSGTSFDTVWKGLTAQDVGAATPESVAAVQTAASNAQSTANGAIQKTGGTFSGEVTFAGGIKASELHSLKYTTHLNVARSGYSTNFKINCQPGRYFVYICTVAKGGDYGTVESSVSVINSTDGTKLSHPIGSRTRFMTALPSTENAYINGSNFIDVPAGCHMQLSFYNSLGTGTVCIADVFSDTNNVEIVAI